MPQIIIHPMSQNSCWQGRRFLNSEAKLYIQNVCRQIPKRKMIDGFVELHLTFYLNSLLRSDVSNFVKIIEDCLVKRGLIKDDRYVLKLIVEKRQSKIEGIDFSINKYEK